MQIEEYQVLGWTPHESVKKTVEKVEKIYEKSSIKTIHRKKIFEKVRKLIDMKRAAIRDQLVDKRTGNVRNNNKRPRKAKNGKYQMKLADVLDERFSVASEVPKIEKRFL